jgi:hypothetical protein
MRVNSSADSLRSRRSTILAQSAGARRGGRVSRSIEAMTRSNLDRAEGQRREPATERAAVVDEVCRHLR